MVGVKTDVIRMTESKNGRTPKSKNRTNVTSTYEKGTNVSSTNKNKDTPVKNKDTPKSMERQVTWAEVVKGNKKGEITRGQ